MSILNQPEFYDIFGLLTFTFITIISIWSLRTEKKFPRWALIILLIIGILGLLVDGIIVFKTFLA